MRAHIEYLEAQIAAAPSRAGTTWYSDRQREIESTRARLALMS
jgi:hypothetical protein